MTRNPFHFILRSYPLELKKLTQFRSLQNLKMRFMTSKQCLAVNLITVLSAGSFGTAQKLGSLGRTRGADSPTGSGGGGMLGNKAVSQRYGCNVSPVAGSSPHKKSSGNNGHRRRLGKLHLADFNPGACIKNVRGADRRKGTIKVQFMSDVSSTVFEIEEVDEESNATPSNNSMQNMKAFHGKRIGSTQEESQGEINIIEVNGAMAG